MQYYTKQQIAGGTRYFGKTLVGNWNEEYEQKDNLVQGILLGEMNGTLRLSKFTRKLETLGAGVRLPGGGADGTVELGKPVEIVALQNGNRLAVDLDEADAHGGLVTATTPETYRGPSARTTFVLEQYVPPKPNAYDAVFPGTELRYGMKVRVRVNPDATGGDASAAPLLVSEPASTGAKARLSKHQLVYLSRGGTSGYSSVWQVIAPKASDRAAAEGLPVLQGAPVALVHSGTQMPLCVEAAHKVLTDFGFELEVSAHASVANNRVDALDDLFQGRELRPEANVFLFNAGFEEAGAEGAAEGAAE